MNALLSTCAAVLLTATGGAMADQNQIQNTNTNTKTNTTTGDALQANEETQVETYDITLHRPVTIGYTTRIRAEGSEHRSITGVIDGVSQKFDEHEISVNFDADAEVLAIDAVGRPISMQYTVHICTMKLNGQSYIIAPAESVITATRRSEGTVFEMDGEPLSENATAALDIVAALPAGGPTNDELFGASTPQAVGDEWPINVEAAMDTFGDQKNADVSAGDINGRSTLLAVNRKNGRDCLMISSRVTVQNTVPGLDNLPSGFNVHRAFMTMMKQAVLPVDHDFQPVQGSMNMDLEAVLIGSLGPDQPETVLHLSGTRAATRTFEPISAPDTVSRIFE